MSVIQSLFHTLSFICDESYIISANDSVVKKTLEKSITCSSLLERCHNRKITLASGWGHNISSSPHVGDNTLRCLTQLITVLVSTLLHSIHGINRSKYDKHIKYSLDISLCGQNLVRWKLKEEVDRTL
jgi:hypothetical protein